MKRPVSGPLVGTGSFAGGFVFNDVRFDEFPEADTIPHWT